MPERKSPPPRQAPGAGPSPTRSTGRRTRPLGTPRPAGLAGLGGSEGPAGVDLGPPESDPLGRMALYSSGERQTPALGLFIVECSSCRRETPLSPLQLARASLPFSIHLPIVKRYQSYMRCPACGRRTWLRVSLKL